MKQDAPVNWMNIGIDWKICEKAKINGSMVYRFLRLPYTSVLLNKHIDMFF